MALKYNPFLVSCNKVVFFTFSVTVTCESLAKSGCLGILIEDAFVRLGKKKMYLPWPWNLVLFLQSVFGGCHNEKIWMSSRLK